MKISFTLWWKPEITQNTSPDGTVLLVSGIMINFQQAQEIFVISKASKLALGATQPPVNKYWGFFPESKVARL
jgi:hypothetical protein